MTRRDASPACAESQLQMQSFRTSPVAVAECASSIPSPGQHLRDYKPYQQQRQQRWQQQKAGTQKPFSSATPWPAGKPATTAVAVAAAAGAGSADDDVANQIATAVHLPTHSSRNLLLAASACVYTSQRTSQHPAHTITL